MASANAGSICAKAITLSASRTSRRRVSSSAGLACFQIRTHSWIFSFSVMAVCSRFHSTATFYCDRVPALMIGERYLAGLC